MRCMIGLGSNMGARRRNLREALDMMTALEGVELVGVSFFYETEPWGVEGQRAYINAVAAIETELEPLELLDRLQEIETALGRVRVERWGSRTIDLDILTIDDLIIDSERLKVPHPLMKERAFVQIPLRDLIELGDNPRGSGEVVRTHGSPMDYGLKLMACVDRGWGLGREGRLLYRIEEDMRRFRSMTLGGTVIMGRRTYESIGRPLDGRRNIVLTHGSIEGVETVSSVAELFERLSMEEKNFVIGGGQVYRRLMGYVVEANVTMVDGITDADVWMVDLDGRREFELIERSPRGGFEFRRYRRHADIQERLGEIP
ncbi:MAG: 2-amino-4-hydroxy-6-hydroxymethyldihydropteridine diphosphokinase [Selenomonadaceae bacterium]|nr:2-amino-4-hydroxy-6-hydroxymethyldihydropteridine diphosphokinase [Selenomonadaceae bacterium]